MRFTVWSDHHGPGRFCATLRVRVQVEYWGFDDLRITDENGDELTLESLHPHDQEQIRAVIEERRRELHEFEHSYANFLWRYERDDE